VNAFAVRRSLFTVKTERPTAIGQRPTILFLIALLVITGCRRQQPLSRNLNAENKVAVRTVSLYYESPEFLLAPERRNIPLPENPAAALDLVMRELLKGSANAAVARLLPGDTIIRGAYLLPDGTAFIDLGGPTLSQGWTTGSHQELMAIYSVVQTVTANFPEAKRVRVLVNGEPAETLAGHVSLSRALTPVPSMVAR
jgi:spore germination protein GerM